VLRSPYRASRRARGSPGARRCGAPRSPAGRRPSRARARALYRGDPHTAPLDLANTLRGLALVTATRGDHAGAIALWREAGALYAAAGIEAGVAESAARVAALTAQP